MPFPPTPTSERSFHSGNCHCGAVRFSLSLSPPLHEYPTNLCDCSICTKNGYLLLYPFLKDFTLESGEDVLKDYKFAERKVRHQFCGECGGSCFIRLPEAGSPPILVINVYFVFASPCRRYANFSRLVCFRISTMKRCSSTRSMEGLRAQSINRYVIVTAQYQ